MHNIEVLYIVVQSYRKNENTQEISSDPPLPRGTPPQNRDPLLRKPKSWDPPFGRNFGMAGPPLSLGGVETMYPHPKYFQLPVGVGSKWA